MFSQFLIFFMNCRKRGIAGDFPVTPRFSFVSDKKKCPSLNKTVEDIVI